MFTNEEILRIAMEQSAIDSNCTWEDFLKKDNVTVTSVANPAARRYLKLPHVCDLTSYGNNIVATISEEYRDIVEDYISRLAIEILERGKVPFYCCAWANIKSVRNAIKSGFRPAWVQMTVKTLDMINEMNGIK